MDVDPLTAEELAPPVGLSSGPLGVAQAADREIARLTAVRARAVVAFTATRPASADRQQGEKGAMSAERWAARPEVLRPVSEWAAQELSVALSITTQAAETLMERSLALVDRLPGTLVALEGGALHAGHLFCLLEKVAPIADDAVRAEVETTLLRWAAGRVTTPAQLAAKARREVLKRDARAAARALERAIARRGLFCSPGPVDGMGTVTAALTLPESRAFMTALGDYADAVTDDPEAPVRTREQKMADALMDLVVHRTEVHDAPPVQVVLTLIASVATALGGDAPGEIDGQPVPAEMVRGLLRALTGTDLTAPELTVRDPGAGDRILLDEDWVCPPDAAELAFEAEAAAQWAQAQDALCARISAGEFDGHWPPDHGAPLDEDIPLAPGATLVATAAARTLRDVAVAAEAGPTTEPADDWWGRADRAVEDACRAQDAADTAIGHAGRMVRTAAAYDAGDEHEWASGPGGRLTAAEDAMTALGIATRAQREELGRLLARTGGGGLAERPRIAVTNAVTGALLSLTDLPGLRAAECSGLGPPPETDAYRPSAALDRFLRARDRRCRFPGCRRPVPGRGELDHDRPYPDGPTAAANMAGYCTQNHRGKHQAPGWQHELHPDGRLTVTTPTGLTTTTEPPPY